MLRVINIYHSDIRKIYGIIRDSILEIMLKSQTKDRYPTAVYVHEEQGLDDNRKILFFGDEGLEKEISIFYIEETPDDLDLPQVGSNKAILYYPD